MPITLTDTAIRKEIRESRHHGRRDLADANCRGLRLRLGARNQATWVLACRDAFGRMRRFPLGTYPEVGISQARSAARALHVKVKQDGADPIAERRRQRAAGAMAGLGEGTLAALLEIYGEKVGSQKRTWGEARARIEKVFSQFLRLPLVSVTAHDLQTAADAYPYVMSASAAVRYLRPILKWAEQRGIVCPDNRRIYPPASVKRRTRVLDRRELAKLLPVLKSSPKPHPAALLFMLLTLARREEVGEARWGDVDLESGLWHIPRPKNNQPNVVPLSAWAIEILKGRHSSGAQPDAYLFCTSNGGKLSNWDRETKAIQRISDTEGWSRHDLRRTGATLLGEAGELPEIIEAALNHTSIRSSLAATYNRARYRPQVANALRRLADILASMISDLPSDI